MQGLELMKEGLDFKNDTLGPENEALCPKRGVWIIVMRVYSTQEAPGTLKAMGWIQNM